jgi:hypothetical protein
MMVMNTSSRNVDFASYLTHIYRLLSSSLASGICPRKLLALIPMLHNTSPLPPIPIHDLSKTLRAVVQPTLRRPKRRSQRRDTLASPNRTQDIPRAVKSVLRRRIVVDVVVCDVCEGSGNIFFVDESLREGIGAEFGFWFRRIGAADTGWRFGRAGLSFLDRSREDCQGREERGEEDWDVHCFELRLWRSNCHC